MKNLKSVNIEEIHEIVSLDDCVLRKNDNLSNENILIFDILHISEYSMGKDRPLTIVLQKPTIIPDTPIPEDIECNIPTFARTEDNKLMFNPDDIMEPQSFICSHIQITFENLVIHVI